MSDYAKIEFETEDGRPLEELTKELGEKIVVIGTANGLQTAMDEVGIRATSEFMINAGGLEGAVDAPVHPSLLTIRTGRLAGSLLNNFTFSIKRLPTPKQFLAKKKPKTIRKFKEGKKEGFQDIIYNRSTKEIYGEKGTNVEYAGVHEDSDRSYLKPAVKKVNVKKHVEDGIGDALKKTGWK